MSHMAGESGVFSLCDVRSYPDVAVLRVVGC